MVKMIDITLSLSKVCHQLKLVDGTQKLIHYLMENILLLTQVQLHLKNEISN